MPLDKAENRPQSPFAGFEHTTMQVTISKPAVTKTYDLDEDEVDAIISAHIMDKMSREGVLRPEINADAGAPEIHTVADVSQSSFFGYKVTVVLPEGVYAGPTQPRNSKSKF